MTVHRPVSSVPTPPVRRHYSERAIRVGLLGCGTVGSAVAEVLLNDSQRVEVAAGGEVHLTKVAVAHPFKERSIDLRPEIVTTDALSVACDLDIDVVVEVIGGIELPRQLIHAAIADGKSVITANKELLAVHGEELASAATAKGVHLLYEAAACAAIPIIRCLQDSLAATPIRRVTAILNGTTNFILSEMGERKCSFQDALHEAQLRGYAEADPSADITGRDAVAKAILLATIVSGSPPVLGMRSGISRVTAREIETASSHGRTLKLVAQVDFTTNPATASVEVKALPVDHPLAHVRGVDNGVLIELLDDSRLFFSGPGAGGGATAVAILGDLVQVAKDRIQARDPRHLACV